MDISAILTKNYPGKAWLLDGNEYSGLEWLDSSAKPTEKQLADQWQEVEYTLAVKLCEEQRQAAYVAESDPLFFKYQRSEDGVTKAAWLAKVDEIRERYPMPEKPAE